MLVGVRVGARVTVGILVDLAVGVVVLVGVIVIVGVFVGSLTPGPHHPLLRHLAVPIPSGSIHRLIPS